MKDIFILTNFSAYLKSYSPIIVVGEQLKMFKTHGYNPVLITAEGWEPPEDSIFAECENRQIFPAHVYNEAKVDDVFAEEVERLNKEIDAILTDNCVVITHDLIFLPDYVKHNLACRQIAEKRPNIQWIHWIHSATNPNQLIQEREMYGEKYLEFLTNRFPNSIIAFPNSGDIERVAANFSYETDQVHEVPHSTDPVRHMEPIVKRLWNDLALYEKDIIMVLPIRLDRGKNAEVNIRVMKGIKEVGLNGQLIVCDFQSTGDDKVVYREDLKKLAEELGITNNVTFLSEFDEQAHMEVDNKVIDQLFQLSNVFISASKSETYSLIAQEAMSKGNLCILNNNFAPMRSIYGQYAIYRQFDSNVGSDGMNGETTVNYDDIDEYMLGIAKNIKYYTLNDKILAGKTFVRRDRNPHAVFKNYLEPLLYRIPEDY